MTVKKAVCYFVNPKIVLRREGKDALLFNPEDGSIEALNETGVFVYRLCNGTNKIEDIFSKASKKFSGDKKKIFSDIKSFLEDLKKIKIIGERK